MPKAVGRSKTGYHGHPFKRSYQPVGPSAAHLLWGGMGWDAPCQGGPFANSPNADRMCCMEKLLAEIQMEGRDEIRLYGVEGGPGVYSHLRITAVGCLPLLTKVHEFRGQMIGKDLNSVPIPAGGSHAELLLRELFLRARKEWHPPYTDTEICHCRLVPTFKVMDAIRAGAQTNEDVSAMTSATTACGSCGPDVRALIDYYYK